jgi:alpha-glucosidase
MLRCWQILLLLGSSRLVLSQWYNNGNFYQVYPRSFMDSDGDGIGDLKGIKSKLQYIKDLGMDGVWLSPIYKSPMADFGYVLNNFLFWHKIKNH